MKDEDVVITLLDSLPSFDHLITTFGDTPNFRAHVGFHHRMPYTQDVQEGGEGASRRLCGHVVTPTLSL